jgi:hypothetical protein
MKTLIQTLFHRMASWWQECWHVSLELLALRHQFAVLKRSGKQPQFSSSDRCFWLLVSRWWSRWPHALEIIQADTVRRWRRQGLWHHVQWRRGRTRPGRPPIPAETRTLIREMRRDNVLWGAPRIHGELAKLGIPVSRTTGAKDMIRRSTPPSATWRTFIRNQAPDLVVAETYAALSSHVRAVSTQVVQALRLWLSWLVSAWLCRSGRRHATVQRVRYDSIFVPIVLSRDMGEQSRVCGRSPPSARLPSPDHLCDAELPLDVGRADVRRQTPVTTGCAPSPNLLLPSQEAGSVRSTDTAEQAAA